MIPLREKKLSELTFVAFDVETTGLDPQRDRIIEIGAIRFDQDGPRGEHEQLVNPGCPIPRNAIAVHGITNEAVASCPTLETALPRAIEFFGDCILLAHNAPFDKGFFDVAFAEAGMKPLPNPILCTVELARAAFPAFHDHKLTTLVRRLRIPVIAHHRALADAAYSAEVFRKCVECMDSGWGASLDNLLQCHGPPIRFGVTASQALEAIEEALNSGASIRIEYRSASGTVTIRNITPLSIEGRGSSTRIPAFCHLRKEKRTFRLDSIRRIL